MIRITDILRAFRFWFNVWTFIARHRLWHYFIYPFAIAVLLAMGVLAFIKESVTALFNRLPVARDFHLPQWSAFNTDTLLELLSAAGDALLRLVILILVFWVSIRVFKYLFLILLSPLMSLISERAEEILTGRSFPFRISTWLRDMQRGVVLSLRNFLLEMAYVIILGGLNLGVAITASPLEIIVAPLTAFVLWLIGAYYYGFSLYDYCLERRGYTGKQRIQYIKANRSRAMGHGIIFQLLCYLYVPGMAVAAVTCPIAVAIDEHEHNAIKSKSE